MSEMEEEEVVDLPPGFRFYPTDEELVTHYLARKAMDARFTSTAIRDVDLYKSEPWELACEEEGYFFCMRDRKYPSGLRSNRATLAGYWKSTGKDKGVYRGGVVVGKKKTLVFYGGRAPRGEKTSWVMHEYTLGQRSTCHNFLRGAQGEWVICRVFMKKHQSGRIEMEHDQEAVNGFNDKMEDTGQMTNCLSNSHCMKMKGDGKEEQMLHEESLMKNSSCVLPSLLLRKQLGTHCSTMHIIQSNPSDNLPNLLNFDHDDLPIMRGASQETRLTSNEMNKNNPAVSSVGSLHLDEPSWNF